MGDLKLVEWFEDGSVELYDLAQDPGEREDLSEVLPRLADDFQARLATWRGEVGAEMPRPDPEASRGGGE